MSRNRTAASSRRRRAALLAAGLVALALPGTAVTAPADLDPSFGAAGISFVDLGKDERASHVVALPGGGVLVGGEQFTGGDSDAVVARLTPEGGLDPGYGGGSGWSVLDFEARDGITGLDIQSDGRIIVAGTAAAQAGPRAGWVARITNPGGLLEPSFGWFGITRTVWTDGTPFAPRGMVLQPDDRILLTGTVGSGAAAGMGILRLTPSGSIDPGFGQGTGWARIDIPDAGGNPAEDLPDSVALGPDGRITVIGKAEGVPGIGVARVLSPTGTPDPSFGPPVAGTAVIPNRFALPRTAALQPDGAVLVGGSDGLIPFNGRVWRLTPNGALDPAFGTGGRIDLGLGAVTGIATQADGKIIVVGVAGNTGDTDAFIARFAPTGIPDATFAGDGRLDIDLGGVDSAGAVTVRDDGRIIVTATSTARADLTVLRFLGDPPPPATPPPGPAGPSGGGPGPLATPAPMAFCAGRRATIVGTGRNDRLTGTPGVDVIAGLGGNDVISGLGGNDVLCGGPGADALVGGPGADTLVGGVGRDRLLGGPGRDRLIGGPGLDVLLGGLGRNTVTR